MIQKVRRKIEELEMCRWTGHNPEEMIAFCAGLAHDIYEMPWGYSFHIYDYSGHNTEVLIGDYVIKYPRGGVSIYHPGDFDNTFEIIKE